MLTSALVLGLLGGAALVYCTMVVAFMAEDPGKEFMVVEESAN